MRLTAAATHLCALAALGYAARGAQFAPSWIRVPDVATLPDAPFASIVVPARNEARSIERCVRSLLAQTLPHFEVIVVDDRSEDETPQILARLAAENPRLRIVRGEPLPEGWVGKPWALAQGAALARGTWLLFTDADSRHAPHSVSSAIAFARERAVDAVSIGTYQELGSPAERAILPSILALVLFATGTFGEINDPARPDKALANGQYLLISRPAYDALGGHAAVRDRIAEDLEFARHLKADGRFRLLLAGGESLASVRMYTSLREIWDGFTKNIYFGANGDLAKLAGGVAAVSLVSWLPPLLLVEGLVRRRPWQALEAGLATATTIAAAARAMHLVRLDPRLGWFQPLGTAFFAAVTIRSTALVLSGRGVDWRGRRYTQYAGGGRDGGEAHERR
ncbi:MAG: glycosyltransferase family 2 protein [Candidatus Velthaea sp.]